MDVLVIVKVAVSLVEVIPAVVVALSVPEVGIS